MDNYLIFLKFLITSVKFPDNLEIVKFQRDWKVSLQAKKITDNLKSVQTSRKVLRYSNNFTHTKMCPDRKDRLKNPRKFGRFPDKPYSTLGKYPETPEIFQTVLNVFKQSKKMKVWTLPKPSNVFLVCLETIRIALRFSGKARNVETIR